MSDIQKKTVSIYIDQSAAESALDKLQNKADGFNKKIDEARQKQTALRQEIEKLEPAAKSVDTLRKDYDTLAKSVDTTTKNIAQNNQAQRDLKTQAAALADKLESAAAKQAVLTAEIKKNEDAGKSVVALQRSYAVVEKEIQLTTDKLTANNAQMQVAKQEADALNSSLSFNKTLLAALNKELHNGEAAAGSISKAEKEFAMLDKTIAGNTKSLEQNGTAIRKVQSEIDSNMRPSLTAQSNLVKQLDNELQHLSQDAPEYAAKFAQFQTATDQLQRLKTEMYGVKEAQKSWFAEAKTVAFGVLIGNTVQSAIQAVGSYFSGIVSGNATLSDSFKDVSKATGLTDAEVAKLNSNLGKIDTRTPTAQLREIAIGLGQVNQEANKANVAAVNKIVVSLGDEFGGGAREITTELTVLRNNLQDLKTANYGDDILHIGNALNVAGAEGVATAPQVTDIANRIAGVGEQFKLTSGQILGFAATFPELGIDAERGSTAIVKTFQRIGAEPEKFAKVAGLSIQEFKHLVNTDMVGAFEAVAKGAQKAGSDNITFSQILKELNSDGSGAGEVLSKLANNSELLDNKIKSMTVALQNGDSILSEFNKKNSGLGSELDKLQKNLNSFIQSRTLSDLFSSGVGALNNFINALRATPQYIKDNSTALTLIITGIAILNASYIKAGILIVRDTALKLINAATTRATAVATNISIAAQAAYIEITTLLAGRITIAAAAQRLWNIAMSLGAGPIGVLVIAVGALALGLSNLFGKSKEITAQFLLQADVEKQVAESIGDQKEKLSQLASIAQDVNQGYETRKKALDELIAQNPDYLQGLTLENITTQKGVDIINDYIDSLDRLAQAKALVDIKSELSKNRITQNIDLKVKQEDANNQGEVSKFFNSPFGTGAENNYLDAQKENIETTKKFNAATLEINDSISKLNFDIGVQQTRLKGLKEGTDDYLKTQRDLNTLIRERNIYQGLPQDTGVVGAPPPKKTTPGVNPFGDDDKDKKAAELLKQLKDFQAELQRVGKQSDDSEVARITYKYQQLTAEAAKYGVHVIDLEKDKNAAIAFLIDEEVRKRKEANDKQFKETSGKEYEQALADSAAYYEGLKKQQAESFVAKQIDQKQYDANIAAIDVASKQAELNTAEDYSGAVEKAAADVTKFKKGELAKQVADLIAANTKMLANEQLTKQLANDAAIARANNRVNTSAPGSKERLAAEKALLNEQKTQELAAIDDREKAAQQAGIQYTTEFNDLRAEINNKYRQTEKQKDIEYYSASIEAGLNYLSSALNIIGQFNEVRNHNEQRALDLELKNNDKRKAALDKQLKQRVISQQTYQQEIAKLDADAETKKEALAKKQFERNKRMQIAQALIDIPKAILTDIRNYGAPIPPNFLSIAAVGFDAILGAAQVAAIAAQKFAGGGRVNHPGNGRITTPSNIPVQPNGDDVLATVKRGEVIMNEDQQRRAGGPEFFRRIGVPGFAMGGVVKPAYQTRSYQAIDYAGATRSLQTIRHYATGGLVVANSNNQAPAADPLLLALLQSNQEVLENLHYTVTGLQQTLSKPIEANANISLKKIDDAYAQQDRILNEATFK